MQKAENSMNANYTGKVVLITGAGRGLGRELVKSFAQAGARVAANDLTPVNLDQTLAEAQQLLPAARKNGIQSFLGDISQKMSVQGVILNVLDQWGRLDVVVNNAAVRPRAALLEMDEWDWRRTIDVNLTGTFFVNQVAGRVMREQGGGVILNIGEGCQEYPQALPLGAYFTSKSAVETLTRQAARELASYGIRVNALLPGLLEGESLRELYPEPMELDRVISPEETCKLALYLCDSQQSAITGQIWRLEH